MTSKMEDEKLRSGFERLNLVAIATGQSNKMGTRSDHTDDAQTDNPQTHGDDHMVQDSVVEDNEEDWEDCSDDDSITGTEPVRNVQLKESRNIISISQKDPPSSHQAFQQLASTLNTSDDARDAMENTEMPGDVSTFASREVWRLFESTRHSAVFHLEQYFRYRTSSRSSSWPVSRTADQTSGTRTLSRKHHVEGAGCTDSQWRFKVARDSLLHELANLRDLLQILEGRRNNGNSGPTSVVLEAPTSPSGKGSWTNWANSWSTSNNMTRCRLKIEALIRKVEDQSLDEANRGALDGKRFQMLWWTGHLYT
jgi:hypothetical protein